MKKSLVEPGTLIAAFSNLPLPGHKNALKAAQSAECARRQDRFWPVHDLFFSGTIVLDRASMWGELTALGIDMEKFKGCINGPVTAHIDAEMLVASALGVEKTPAFAIGPILADGRVRPDKLLQGLSSLDDIKSAVNGIR